THPVRRAVVARLLALVLGGKRRARREELRQRHRQGSQCEGEESEGGGLTSDGRSLCVPAKSADEADVVGSVTGLGTADSALIGIDFRAQDGKLYSVGNGGGVYTVDPRRTSPS